jgi:nicotinamide mononucleotide transporter
LPVLSLEYIELIAVGFNVAYVVLAWYQKRLCWLFGAIGSALSAYYFQHEDIRLYSEAGLYVFYVLIAVYGWWIWSRPDSAKIHVLAIARHFWIIGLGLVAAIALSQVTGRFTDAARPMADSLSTVFGVIATFLTIKKVLSNWIYWIVIDLFSVWLYLARNSEIYAAQMFLFTVLAIYGYYQWRKEYKSKAYA